MGFFKSTTPQPAEVSKQTIQFCTYAIAAVALAEILGCGLEMLQQLIHAHNSGLGVFRFATISALFWIAAKHGLIVLGAALLGFFINKRMRDAAVAAQGFCLARVLMLVIPAMDAVYSALDGAAQVLLAMSNVLELAVSVAALAALFLLVRRWPAAAKPVA